MGRSVKAKTKNDPRQSNANYKSNSLPVNDTNKVTNVPLRTPDPMYCLAQ